MSVHILDGARVARQVRREVAERVARLREVGVTPGLAVILVGDDPASATYVRNKERACAEVGINSETFCLPATTTQEEVLALVHHLNKESGFHGILVQTPLPAQIDEPRVMAALDPSKDVDGLHPENMGRLLLGQPRFIPCTPQGIQQLLLRSGYDSRGQHVVICGRSEIVGKPLAALLMQKVGGADATVTVCHSRTPDLAAFTRQADILVAAMGRPGAITAEMVKPGAIVIDVGITPVPDTTTRSGTRLVGDVDFVSVANVAQAITPVPGGVGPMTVAMLLVNTVQAAEHASLKLG